MTWHTNTSWSNNTVIGNKGKRTAISKMYNVKGEKPKILLLKFVPLSSSSHESVSLSGHRVHPCSLQH